MKSSRPLSQASSNHSSTKPGFQTKTRPRIRGMSNIEEQFYASTNLERQNQTNGFHTSRSERLLNEPKDQVNEDFYRTASQLSQINFDNHCSENCVCQDCTCGRHLCKFNNIKPDLSKSTVYQKDFVKKGFSPVKVVYAKQYEKLDGPHLSMNSTQRLHFTDRQGDKIQRPKPQDLLKSQGPALSLTSYKALYPGHRGPNQYIKPTDKHIRQKFPLRSKSTYSQNFVKKDPPIDDYKYFNDQLKTGGNWYGDSTYGKFFENPNPQYHARKVKIIEKRQLNPDFKHQYETMYKNEFLEKETAVCSAKVNLQTKRRGNYSNSESKQKFGENTDFKAMSPEYQSFATSRFSFV